MQADQHIEIISRAITEYCNQQGISDAEFARRLGISRQRLSQWHYYGANFATVCRLAEAAGMKPSEFVGSGER